jgi:hypothetical protein
MGKLARCEMNLNNSSWKIIAPTCPEASLPRPQVSAALIEVSPRRR